MNLEEIRKFVAQDESGFCGPGESHITHLEYMEELADEVERLRADLQRTRDTLTFVTYSATPREEEA